MEKQCSKCGISKPLDDFARTDRTKIGRVAECNACRKTYREKAASRIKETKKREYERNKQTYISKAKAWGLANRDRLNETNNARNKRKRLANPQDVRRKQMEFVRSHPLEIRARQAVCRAIKRGILIRTTCEICGNVKSQAHHYLGYAKEHRLTVRWLCQSHHTQAHNAMRGGDQQ